MNERQKKILHLINEQSKISVSELSSQLDVTPITIRRDLNFLEQNNYLRREHGYAVSIHEEKIDSRIQTNFLAKQAMAEFAATLIEENETIFIEGGSTNALLARLLTKRSDITVITMNTYISNILNDGLCNVILLGGLLQKESQSMVGPISRAALQYVNFSKSFIGVDGYTPETGFTGRDMMRSDTLNCVIQKCPHNIIMIDSSKFGLIYPNAISPKECIHQVITNEVASEDILNSLRDFLQVNVINNEITT